MPKTPKSELVVPRNFEFDPDLLADYEEQVEFVVARNRYQDAPVPSFEGVPVVDIKPNFNPTSAPVDEIFGRNRVPRSMQPSNAVRSDWDTSGQPVIMWRILERDSLKDGSGLVCSGVLLNRSLGDVEGFNSVKHLASNHARRTKDGESVTPFVSFSTDPLNLAREVILRHGFGVRNGRDSVVVKVVVEPDRVITGPMKKEPEVFLLGGVAPSEYIAAYAVQDFVNQLVPEGEVALDDGSKMDRDKVLGHWAIQV